MPLLSEEKAAQCNGTQLSYRVLNFLSQIEMTTNKAAVQVLLFSELYLQSRSSPLLPPSQIISHSKNLGDSKFT